jgi:hypothetical protein
MFAQINISKLSLEGGYFRNYQLEFDIQDEDLFSFGQEFRIGGMFFTDKVNWSLSVSYWDDGIDKPLPIMDLPTYSYSSTNFGFGFELYPTKYLKSFPIPIHFLTRFSSRFINEEYVGGESLTGTHRKAKDSKVFSFDFGVGLRFNIYNQIDLICDAMLFIPLNEEEFLANEENKNSFLVGLQYNL